MCHWLERKPEIYVSVHVNRLRRLSTDTHRSCTNSRASENMLLAARATESWVECLTDILQAGPSPLPPPISIPLIPPEDEVAAAAADAVVEVIAIDIGIDIEDVMLVKVRSSWVRMRRNLMCCNEIQKSCNNGVCYKSTRLSEQSTGYR